MPRAKKPTAPAGKANRHDTVMPSQTPAAPTGMAYGAHADSIQAQQAVPLPQAPPPGAAAPAPGGAPGGGQAPGFGGALAAASAMAPPSQTLADPTLRPNEPFTAGAPFGPGPGPEALTANDPLVKGAAYLNSLGEAVDPATQRLRDQVNAAVGNKAAP